MGRRVGTGLQCVEGEAIFSNAIQDISNMDLNFNLSSMDYGSHVDVLYYEHKSPTLSYTDMIMEEIVDPLLD